LTVSFGHAYKWFEDNFMNETFLQRLGLPHGGTPATLFAIAAMAVLAAGCGGSSKTPTAASGGGDSGQAQAQEEEKAAPAGDAAAPAPVAKRRNKLIALKTADTAAVPPPPPSNKDFSKWEMADLDAALARRDLMFVPGAVMFSVRDLNDAKRAQELAELAQRVAKLKDDPTIPLAMPSAASPVGAKAPQAGAPAAAAPAAATPVATPATTTVPGGADTSKLPALKFDFGRRKNN
jgi:hypothetical protein